MKELNRIKQVLAANNKTGKWLCKQLGKDPATVSRWCNNRSQPSLESIDRIAELLKIDRRELLNRS